MKSMKKILIIGSGPTGCYIANLLSKHASSSSLSIQLWDKGRSCGGRMTTSISRGPTSFWRADTGAQYFTETNELLGSIYKGLVDAGSLRPLTGPIHGQSLEQQNKLNFVAINGVSSVPAYFLSECGDSVSTHQSTKVVSIASSGGRSNNVEGLSGNNETWTVNAERHRADGTLEMIREIFDVVIVTVPSKQVVPLFSNSFELPSHVKNRLDKTTYSCRFVLTLYFALEDKETLEREFPYVGYYVDRSQDGVIRYISFDSKKRNNPEESPSLVIHTSVSYGRKHENEAHALLLDEMYDHFKALFPKVPFPVQKKTHKWKFSQVETPYEKVPDTDPCGAAKCQVVSNSPLLVLAGDYFSVSNLGGCVESATDAVATLKII
jgi:predicted NAD/FAD-dependent oxidoreductase